MRLRTRQALATALLLGLAACSHDQGASPDSPATFQPRSLLEAVLVGDEQAARAFLAKGDDPNAAEPDGTTVLMRAIHGGSPTIAQLLIDAGANVSAANRYGVTPLYLAAQAHDAVTARALLRAGADANTALPDGETILMTASKTGSVDIVRALLGQTDDAALANATETTEVGAGYASATPRAADNRADPNAKEGWYGQTALMWAAAEGHADVVAALIEAGANVNEHSDLFDAPEPHPDRLEGGFAYPQIPRGQLTALHFASRQGRLEAARTLIDAGADLNAVDEDGANALILATLNSHFDLAGILLDAGADPNVADIYGRTVLFVAVDLDTVDDSSETGSEDELAPIDIVKLALAKGAKPDAPLSQGVPGNGPGTDANSILNKGATPFLRAAMSGDLDVMNLLLAAGANPLVATARRAPTRLGNVEQLPNGGTTTLMAAAGVGWRESVSRGRESNAIKAIQLLLDRGADINAANQSGDTALHGATLRGSPAIIQFLVDHGANLYARNAKGWTPLDIAMGQPEERIPYNEATASLLRRLMQRS